jgi:hypothetical protein
VQFIGIGGTESDPTTVTISSPTIGPGVVITMTDTPKNDHAEDITDVWYGPRWPAENPSVKAVRTSAAIADGIPISPTSRPILLVGRLDELACEKTKVATPSPTGTTTPIAEPLFT